jgi:beta-lactamase regulating signal transducer with metallopeptidase domain
MLATRTRRYLLGVVLLRHIGRRARSVDDDNWQARLRATAHALGLRQRVELLESVRCTIPMTWGICRPKILLPAAATSWTAARCAVVLAHELAT